MRSGERGTRKAALIVAVLVAAATLALGLAACGGGDNGGGIEGGGDQEVETVKLDGKASGALTISNWPLYIAAAELRVDAGEDPDTDICPVVSASARECVAAAIGRAENDGAELLLDGRGDAGPAGTQLAPMIAAAATRSRSSPARSSSAPC
jgi:hypothetical protein